MKSTLTTVVAWTFGIALALLAVAVGVALMAPLFDTAWMRFHGSQASLLRWLVCTGLAMVGLAVIDWAWGEVAEGIAKAHAAHGGHKTA